MKLGEIHRILTDIFNKELTNDRVRHIVFWYDAEAEFQEDIAEIQLDDVRIWTLSKNNLFATKYELEKKDPTSHFLIYADFPRPLPREDWLYDQFKLGYEFATDKTTVTMRELGATDEALREVFKGYKTFFNNRTRLDAFRKFPIEAYTEEIIDLTVLAVLSKSPANQMDEILKTLFKKYQANDSSALEAIKKYGSEEKLWSYIEKYYGYARREINLQSLLTFLMVTYLNEQNDRVDLPEEWEPFLGSRITNIVVFMNQWMNHREDRFVYNALADQVQKKLQVAEVVHEWNIEDIKGLDGFRLFDEEIIQYLTDQLTENLSEFDSYLDFIDTRRTLHWYSEFEHSYEAIYYAIQLKREMKKIDYFISEQAPNAMFQSYLETYYKLDQAYRKFYVAYDNIEYKGTIQRLREDMENLYNQRYVEELAIKWAGTLERSQDVTWPMIGIPQQQDFYTDWVKPYQKQDERVFVIISDALRYEVAEELMADLNNERKASTGLAAMQGVVPSYTALGMAALLPHQKIAFKEDGRVFLDGENASSLEDRAQILAKAEPDSLALRFNDVMEMNRATLRETIVGKKIIYIYHNTIDARGDNAATEIEVFDAAEDAIQDIRKLVNHFVKNISFSTIIITADHGFLYQRNPLEASQKLPNSLVDGLMMKRRFALHKGTEQIEGTLSYAMDYILDGEVAPYVTVPKGVNRFKVQGSGANYVHGGAMLQEIVLPVITFKNDRSKDTKNIVKKVDVKLTTPIRKITNSITYLEFFQTEKVEEKRIPRKLVLYFADEAGARVSSENILIADREIGEARERTYREKFVFRSLEYDRHKNYYLVLEEESGDEYERYGFVIDI